jgi:hypothetical protein
MTVENASYISGLNSAYPPGSDTISEGDDHLRLIKAVLKETFPNANEAINAIHTGTSAPTSKTAGTLWYDTTSSNQVLKIYNGTDWKTFPVSTETDFKLMGATNVGWVLPTTDGSANQYLKTDAAGNLDWASPAGSELPSQTGHAGKFLTTNGSAVSWAASSGKAASCNFMATMSTHQDVASVTAATVAYDTESWDIGSDFDHTTYKFEAPETGYYAFNVQTRWAGSGGSSAHSMDDDVWLYKNAGAFVSYTALAKDTVTPHAGYIQAYPTYAINCVMNMTAGDTAHVVVRTEAGGFRITGGTQGFFSGYQIA